MANCIYACDQIRRNTSSSPFESWEYPGVALRRYARLAAVAP